MKSVCIHIHKNKTSLFAIEDSTTKPGKKIEKTLKKYKKSQDNMEKQIEDTTEAFKYLQKDQIFIGMVSLKQFPKNHLEYDIKDLRSAGSKFFF